MTHGNEKKPHQPPDFSGPPEIPASTRDFLQNLLQQQRDSVLWTVHPVGGGSLAQRLADNGSIAVHVHAVDSSDSSAGRSPMVYHGKLTRRATVDGATVHVPDHWRATGATEGAPRGRQARLSGGMGAAHSPGDASPLGHHSRQASRLPQCKCSCRGRTATNMARPDETCRAGL